MPASNEPDVRVMTVSVVVPVYRGQTTLAALVGEVLRFSEPTATPRGHRFAVQQVVLVHDGASDDSASVMQQLAAAHPCVRCLWLSRNFGQHPATLAGMASTSGEWVATMDEDGQHDPAALPRMLDTAVTEGAQVVYAAPTNSPPHSAFRNAASRVTKWVFAWLVGAEAWHRFHSYRVVQGDVARALAAYCGSTVYLDVALSWVAATVRSCPVVLRGEMRDSGYSTRRLLQHFWRLVLTSGTGPLRFVSVLGFVSVLLSFALSAYVVWLKVSAQIPVRGWTSLALIITFFGGCVLFVLGIIAEYVGVVVAHAMGKPLYVLLSKPPPSIRGR